VRHQNSGKKLGRDSAHRKALYSNLAGALIEHGRIKTTVTKAKAVKPLAEQMITLGRRGDLHARRQATAFLRSRDVVHHLFAQVAPRFKDRPGGYTRIIKLGPRPGDAAEMVYLELVDDEYAPKARTASAPAAAAVVTEPDVAQAEEPDAADEVAADEAAEDEPEAVDEDEDDVEAVDEPEAVAEAEAAVGADPEAATEAAPQAIAEPATEEPEAEDPK
jgi:large subunit ribosomal protein L17